MKNLILILLITFSANAQTPTRFKILVRDSSFCEIRLKESGELIIKGDTLSGLKFCLSEIIKLSDENRKLRRRLRAKK